MDRLTRILILEDVAADALVEREVRRTGLQFESRIVDTRATLEDALASVAPDVLLVDCSTAGLDGPTALQIARSAHPDLPVILVSGTIGEEEATEAVRCGATDYVLKHRLSRLGPAIARALKEAEEKSVRRRAETELRESEDLYRTVVSALGEGVILAGADGRIVSCNAGAERILGLPKDQLVGKRITDPMGPVTGEDSVTLPIDEFPALVSLRTGEALSNVVLGARKLDGQLLWLSVNCRAVWKEPADRPSAVVVSFADITDRMVLQQQLLRSQRLESVGQLAGGVAHDFNNLVTVINGFTELAAAKLGPANPVERELSEVSRAGERAAALTRQLLAFSRRQVLQSRVLDLSSVVAEMDRMVRRLIGEDIELVTALSAVPGRVKVDPGQIEQVLLNLVVNARDAMPAGGTLTIETSNVDLTDAHARQHPGVLPGPYVILTVSDTGGGMDTLTKERLFEPFFTTKENDRATGLGLATAFGIVKQSGGDVWVNSEPGRGATFKILLPRVEEAAAEAPVPALSSVAAAPEAGGETILVVEDEEALRPLIREILQRNGYAVLEAEDGLEALRVCDKHPGAIHLAITDLVMPHLGGHRLAERLTAKRPGMKVLFMSGYAERPLFEPEALSPGSFFLAKPFTPLGLSAKVREVLAAVRSGLTPGYLASEGRTASDAPGPASVA